MSGVEIQKLRSARISSPARVFAARKNLGGVMGRLLVFLVVVFAAVSLAWMLFLPTVLTSQLRQRTGFDADVQSLAVNPFTGTVEMRGFVLLNPPTFPVREFLEVKRFSADAELFTLFSERPIFKSVELDVTKVTLVRRDAEQTNAGALSHNLSAPEGAPRPPGKSAERRFLIRKLRVHIGELVIADHSTALPTTKSYKLDFNQSYADVSGVRQLLEPSTLQSLAPVAAALNGLLPGAFGQAVGDVMKEAVKSGSGLIKNAGRKAGEKIHGYFDALEESKKP